MATRPNDIESVKVAIELLTLIRRDHPVTAEQLHEHLRNQGIERDVRTVQRQLKALTKHFQIDCDMRSKPYGYQWRKNAPVLSVPGLSLQQSIMFELVSGHLKNLMPASLARSLESYFDQARRNLREPGSRKLERQWLDKVRVVPDTQPLLAPAVAPSILDAVTEALYRNLWLELKYRNVAGHITKNRVMPLGLAQQGPRLYLICRFHGFDDNRALALHRMESASQTTITFDRPADFDLERYELEGRFGFGYGRQIALKMVVDNEHILQLRECPLSTDQTITEQDAGHLVTATVIESAQLLWWLMHFGARVRVLAPQALVARVRDEHTKAAAVYLEQGI